MTQNLISQTNLHDANVAILGEAAVGKTAITVRYLRDKFDPNYEPSVKQEYIKQFKLDDGSVGTVQLLDTGGMEEYETLYDQWIRSNDGFLIVYAIDNWETFEKIQIIIQKIKKIKENSKVPIMIVGNKSDLVDYRQVQKQQAKQLVDDEKNIKFIETSALTSYNCKACINDCIKMIIQKRRKRDEKQKQKQK